MKYKKKVEWLKAKQRWWESKDQRFKDSTTKPGSTKTA